MELLPSWPMRNNKALALLLAKEGLTSPRPYGEKTRTTLCYTTMTFRWLAKGLSKNLPHVSSFRFMQNSSGSKSTLARSPRRPFFHWVHTFAPILSGWLSGNISECARRSLFTLLVVPARPGSSEQSSVESLEHLKLQHIWLASATAKFTSFSC